MCARAEIPHRCCPTEQSRSQPLLVASIYLSLLQHPPQHDGDVVEARAQVLLSHFPSQALEERSGEHRTGERLQPARLPWAPPLDFLVSQGYLEQYNVRVTS